MRLVGTILNAGSRCRRDVRSSHYSNWTITRSRLRPVALLYAEVVKFKLTVESASDVATNVANVQASTT
jgi:hypothetical protein